MKGPDDLGKLSAPHLALRLSNALKRYGVDCLVDRAVEYPNEYRELGPDTEHIYADEIDLDEISVESPESFECKVLVSDPVTGLRVAGPFVSLSDKIDREYQITTNVVLFVEDRLTIMFPDGAQMKVRIMNLDEQNCFSEVWYEYRSIIA